MQNEHFHQNKNVSSVGTGIVSFHIVYDVLFGIGKINIPPYILYNIFNKCRYIGFGF